MRKNYQDQTVNRGKKQGNKSLSFPLKYIPPKVLKQSCHGGGGATKGC